MDERHVEEDKMVEELYEASQKGSVSFLITLIQRDPLILSKVSLTSLRDTPLHIATLHGHLEFCKILLSKKPTFAEEVDSLGRTPLHLASAEGHTEIVQALLQTNTHVCLASDRDERIPLHLAAMRGRKKIVKELISAQPESIRVNFNEESVLHLCVRYNQLDALKCLVESAVFDELLISKDRHGNSILDLAVMLKQKKAIKYLLSVPGIERVANVIEIENTVEKVDVRRSIDKAEPAKSTFGRWWRCVRSSIGKRLKNPENWIEETRGSLMVVATVMATVSFQAGISPPGGVWQENMKKDGNTCLKDNTNTSAVGTAGLFYHDNICAAGTAVLSYSYPGTYRHFISANSSSFFASACVILLIISGFPLTSKFFIWLLSVAMTISVVSMTYAYIWALTLVISPDVYDGFVSLFQILLYILLGVVVFVVLTHIIRPLYWMVKQLHKFIRKPAAACEHKCDHTGEKVCEDDLEHP